MSRSTLPVPDHAGPLAPRVGKLLPTLSGPARYRIAEMAVAMREAALNHGGCERPHLAEAGFTSSEIALGWPLARRVLDSERAFGPAEMVPAFTPADIRALQHHNTRHAPALDAAGVPYARGA